MATISLHRTPETRHYTHPLQSLSQFLSWDPWGDTQTARVARESAFAPPFEVKETKEAFLIRADLPGVKEADLDLKLENDRLVVSGKRESEAVQNTETYHTFERSFGTFTRTFVLGDGVNGDAVTAELKDGVLSLTLPKRPERQPKRINVSTG